MLDATSASAPERYPTLADGWTYVQLGSLIDPARPITYGVVQPGPHDPEGIPLIRGGDYSDGWQPLSQLRRISREIDNACSRGRLKSGDLIITIKGDVGACAMIPSWLEGANLSQTNARLAIDPDKANPKFVLYCLQSEIGRRAVYENTKTGAQPGLIFEDILQFNIPLPEEIAIQNEICQILRSWDDAIKTTTQTVAQKKRALIALRQRLLGVQGIFRPEWPLRELSLLATRIRRRNGGGDHPVMTISAKAGFLLQSDKFSRDMAGTSLENYIELREGEFAYNKGNSKTYPQGCIFRLDRPSALVPHVYFCFALNAGLHSDFYAHVFEAGLLNRQLTRLINSGIRNDGLLNINADDFFGCKLPVPELDEQVAIATALNAAKEEIRLLELELGALQRQKRGLMQKLLTGEWRVKVE